jgi:hypothetical protein
VYNSDHGLEELARRRGEELVSAAWWTARLADYRQRRPDASAVLARVQAWTEQELDKEFLLEALAAELQAFLDADPAAEDTLNAVGSWLARADDEDD